MSGLQSLAADLGASSGRIMLGSFDGSRITLEEIHRFPNHFVSLQGRAYWDILLLLDQIRTGIGMCPASPQSMGIDTWGIDFDLLDKDGILLGNPRSYRDSAFGPENMARALAFLGGKWEVFQRTGIASLPYNTLFQLYSMREQKESILSSAHTLLTIPNLLEYILCGAVHSEYSIFSTTQLLDMGSKCLCREFLEKMGLAHIQPAPLSLCGNVLGSVADTKIKLVSVASHDTASAVHAVPAWEASFAFLSCGTWSLLGMAGRSAAENRGLLPRRHLQRGNGGRALPAHRQYCGAVAFAGMQASLGWSRGAPHLPGAQPHGTGG